MRARAHVHTHTLTVEWISVTLDDVDEGVGGGVSGGGDDLEGSRDVLSLPERRFEHSPLVEVRSRILSRQSSFRLLA